MLLLSALGVATGALNQRQPDHSLSYLLGLTDPDSNPGGRPDGVDPKFDCAWRKLALPYALQIQPSLTSAQQRAIHEALQLDSLCSTPFLAASPSQWQSAAEMDRLRSAGRTEIFVDASKGSDSAAGTMANPLKSLAAAVNMSRLSNHSISDAPLIQLREGAYYLADTIYLSKQDSGLTISAFKSDSGFEAVTLSGGVPLSGLKWAASNKSATGPQIYTTTVDPKQLPNGNIKALQINGQRVTLARWEKIIYLVLFL